MSQPVADVYLSRMEDHFAALNDLVDGTPLTSDRCTSIREILLEVHHCCSESESTCSEVLKRSTWLGSLMTLLDDATFSDLPPEDLPHKRDDCTVMVCQIITNLAAQAEFRHGELVTVQAAVLKRLSALIVRAPEAPALAAGQDGCFRFICEAMTNVCREHKDGKKVLTHTQVVASLVRLLGSMDPRVQRAASSVLRTLAFKDDAAKRAIIDCGAIEPLIRMLRSEDHLTHYEAVGTLGNLVHSSPEIKRAVLGSGVLQPVINLLRCSCRDSLREAALLIGQFAQCDANRNRGARPNARASDTEDYRVKIVQRGAVPPLIEMLKMSDKSLREMAAFALGRLAQNSDNQAGIFAMGALPPLLELLSSGVRNLEHNAAFTLYGLADSVDNVAEIVKQGGYERLRVADFPKDQPTKDCVQKTLKRISERINATAFAKDHLLCLLRSRTPGLQARLATSLAHLLENDDIARAYGTYGGAGVLLEQACDPELAESDPAAWDRALEALQRVVKSCKERQDKNSTSFVPAPPEEKVYIGKGYVNNPRVHDVVFVVEGAPFYAHKLALSASSETFRAMFDSGYLEGGTGIPEIQIPNLSRGVFEAMMMFVYTGEAGVSEHFDILPQLLQAADQYLLEPLKELCAKHMTSQLSTENVLEHYELATQFNATKLEHAALAFLVEHAAAFQAAPAVPSDSNDSTADEAAAGGEERGALSYAYLLARLHPALQKYIDCHLRAVSAAEEKLGDEGEAPAPGVPPAPDPHVRSS
eukprot:jgi/Ulvmu1/7439/UM036_0100.1